MATQIDRGKRVVSVRKATPQDAASIARIQKSSWKTAYRGIFPASYLNRISTSQRTIFWRDIATNNKGLLLIAEIDGHAIGFLHMADSTHDAQESIGVEIKAIYLAPEYWRLGYGSMLIDVAIKLARQSGSSRVFLWVLERNVRARAFYSAHGFRPDGARREDQLSNGFRFWEIRYVLDQR